VIDLKRLEAICRMPVDAFTTFGEAVATPQGNYVFRDNGERVLGVAHLDTVLPGTQFACEGDRVFCPALDDRLGVYLLSDLLPLLGVKFDLLLTDGEERGCSTARWFTQPRKYNWMFSFDRAGTDVVLYQYDTPANRRLLHRAGFRVGVGSYSDIADLDYLGCAGFNFGTGYHHQHKPDCFADLSETREMVSRFVQFWRRHEETHIPHLQGYRTMKTPETQGFLGFARLFSMLFPPQDAVNPWGIRTS
jgi:hypothetical protein